MEEFDRNFRVQDVVSLKDSTERGDGPVLRTSPAQWRSEVLNILNQIQSPLSLFILRLCSWTLLRLLNRMVHSVLLHKGQLEMVCRAAQTPDVPLVFLSTHKSQLDGLLLSFLLFSQGLGVPRVTWEYQAYTPRLRALLSRLGGVFLPPEAEHTPDSKQGALVRAILASYVEELLKSRQHLLIFLEEPFSGVPQLSALGMEWLGLVLGAVYAGAVPDVMLVPMGISYDVAPDVFAGSAQPVGLWSCLLAVGRALGRGFGCVRVDFAQPFSLKEYAANNRFRQSCSGKSLEELLLPVILAKSPSLLGWEKSEEWFSRLGAAAELPADQRILVGKLGLHSLSAPHSFALPPPRRRGPAHPTMVVLLRLSSSFQQGPVLPAGVSCSAIMAVAIVSALLLHKHREGVFLSRLMSDFSWLAEEILLRNHDVGFSGRLRDLVLHTLRLLRGCISLHRLQHGDVLVAPRETEAVVRKLSRHSAALLPIFMCEAVGACAVHALLVEMLPFLGPVHLPADIVLSQEELHCKTLALVQLLPRDVLLLQPCQSASCYSQDVLDKLIQCGLLVAEEAPSERPACDTVRRRFAQKLLWNEMEDDSDYDEGTSKRCFKISQLDNCPDFFFFLCCLLGPLLKTFEQAAAFLVESSCPASELEYVERLQQFMKRKGREDGSLECALKSLVVSSVQTFKELGVLREEPGSLLHLSKTFASRENQERLEKFIGQFASH